MGFLIRPWLRGAATAAVFLSEFCGQHVLASTPIHAGDKLSLTVYNHTDLSTEVSVTSRGDVPVPLAGAVAVAGLDENGAATRIASAMTPYLRHPAVAVRILEEGRSLFFTGPVVGVQPFQPGETLASAIGSFMQKNAQMQGGSVDTSSVDLRRVRIQRDGAASADLNVENLTRSGAPGPTLEPGDVIVLVAKPVRVDIRGDMKAPATVYMYSGETLVQAVDQAGGFGPTTSLANIRLRRDGTDQLVSSAGETFTAPAHDGDIVTLLPAPHVTVLGTVPKPGDVVLLTHPTLMGALYQAGGINRDANLRQVKVVHAGEARVIDLYGMTRGDLSADTSLQDGDVVFVPQGRRLDGSGFLSAIGLLGTLKFLLVP